MSRKYAQESLSKRLTKDDYMREYFAHNRAYLHAKEGAADPNALLEQMRNRFSWYRTSWRELPAKAFEMKYGRSYVDELKAPPLCVDVELASICNLACPFCFRQWIATPDKMMDVELAYKVIDQAADLGVPSIKFNWRGEPTMHPKLTDIIAYAKKKGILETIINTNAVKMDREYCKKLVESGLDVLIYSFDGGSKESYEKNRPGRWEDNTFESVYQHIKDLHATKLEMESPFPFTRIQMILTDVTFPEKEHFHVLFNEYVNDVSTTAYMERGGNLDVLSHAEKAALKIKTGKSEAELSTVNFWKDLDGSIFVQMGRKPCEQPFQRMMISYDGRAFMCCYDWGNEHPIGYVSDRSFSNGDKDYETVMEKVAKKEDGYHQMQPVMPRRNVKTELKVQTLGEIWNGSVVGKVREAQVRNKLEAIEVCKNCTSKATYDWQKLDA